MAGMDGFEDESMFLDPPDPVDLLIAHTEEGVANKPRPLDFVREKMTNLKKENKRLKERVMDLEQTLSIVQTAQEWTVKGMTVEQADKMREIKSLLEKAKKAKEETKNFSGASKECMFEKLRQTKNQLGKERQAKSEMKERLVHAFHTARNLQGAHKSVTEERDQERAAWQAKVRDMKERHRRELRRLQGDAAAQESDRHDQLSMFGEQVMSDLTELQSHLKEVRQETVDSVIAEGIDEDEDGGGYVPGQIQEPPAHLLAGGEDDMDEDLGDIVDADAAFGDEDDLGDDDDDDPI